MDRIIKALETEKDHADTLLEHVDCSLYETEGEYKAYIDGIDFAINQITDTSYVISPSTWAITFADGHILKIPAGDIISCLNKLIEYNETIEEVVKFECLPE